MKNQLKSFIALMGHAMALQLNDLILKNKITPLPANLLLINSIPPEFLSGRADGRVICVPYQHKWNVSQGYTC